MDSQAPKLPEVCHFLDDFRTELGRTGRAGKLQPRSSEETAELRQIFLARDLDKQHAAAYNQEVQVILRLRKRKENRAFFSIIDTHQTLGDHPLDAAPVRMSVLHGPGSWKCIPNIL